MLDCLFSPQNSYCLKCQWDKGKIIKNGAPKYFKTFTELQPPKFLFISFESDLNLVFDLIDNGCTSKISEGTNDRLLYEKKKYKQN